jgi:hypothetical protein
VGDNLVFSELKGAHFTDRNSKPTKVMTVTGGPGNAAAFMYQCILNRDVDGAPNTYGRNNPGGENTLKDKSLQANLDPKDGLGNACGDPGDGSKGWKNFLDKNRNFYWSSLVAIKKASATKALPIDERPELEAGRRAGNGGGKNPTPLLPVGQGYFPVIRLNQPYRGYFISTTAAYTEGTLADTNSEKWVNGLTEPWAVWAGEWAKWKAGGKMLFLGDFGLAINNVTGQSCAFFFADAGSDVKVGESSGKLYEALGNTDAHLCSFIVFPGSGHGNEVGKEPGKSVGLKVLGNMLRFTMAKNVLELPLRLAFTSLEVPTKQAEMTDVQARTYKNVLGALRSWGIWATK